MIPKTLLIGIDGVDYTRFVKFFETPHHWHFHKAYTGGIVGEPTQAGTWSGPGWASVLTGVWTDKHKITGNSPSLRANPQYPNVLRHLKGYNPNLHVTSTVTWPPIHRFFSQQLDGVNTQEYNGDNLASDNAAVKFTKSYIEQGADVNFIQLGWPDYAAHSNGYGPIYDESLETAFAHVEELREAVEARQRKHPQEQWLILITTDHGRTASDGKGHGGHSISEKTVFIASNLPPNAELTDPVAIGDLAPLYSHAAHTGIVPTILRHMGALQPNDALRLDSPPLIGEPGVRKLRLDRERKKLSWYSERTANVAIYKNGRFAQYQRGDALGWEHSSIAWGQFSVQQNGTLASVGKPLRIQSVMGWPDSTAMFFFIDSTYSLFNLETNTILPGYPKTIDETTWKGIAAHHLKIVASVRWGAEDYQFFLNDGTYIKFNKSSDTVVRGPTEITKWNWPGLEPYAAKIKTAVNWKDDKIFFFYNDNTYGRYDVATDKMDDGYPKPVDNQLWPGLAPYSDKLVAAVRKGETNTAYFFFDDMTYLGYDMDQDKALPNYPRRIAPPDWNGLE